MNAKQFEESLRESLKCGGGISWYPYNRGIPKAKVEDLLPILRRVGFQNAKYKKEMKPTHKLCRSIIRRINSGKFYVMTHPNGTKCYIGWHDVGGFDEKQLWVRVIGLNEMDHYWPKG